MLGGLFHHLPYCNFHEQNLDYLESEVKEAKDLAEKASSDAAEALDKVETAQQAASDAKDQADAAADSAAAAEAAATAFEAAPVVSNSIFESISHGSDIVQNGAKWGKVATIDFRGETDGQSGTIFQGLLKEEYRPAINIAENLIFPDFDDSTMIVWAISIGMSGSVRIFSNYAGGDTTPVSFAFNKTFITEV